MKNVKILLITLSFITIFNNLRAQADVAALAGSIAVIEDFANNALEKADNILSAQQRQFFLNLLNYTKYLKQELKEVLDDLDNKLTQKQLSLYGKLDEIMQIMQDESASWKTKIDNSLAKISNSIADLPLTNRKPSPMSYQIPALTTTQKGQVIIRITGKRLANDKNYIVFNNRKVKIFSKPSESEIVFKFQLTQKDTLKEGLNIFKLVLHKKRFLFKDKFFEFTPNFVVYPKKLGTVTVHYKTNAKVREESNGHTDIVHATSGSRRKTKDEHKTFTRVNTEEGWKIDRNSISCWKESGKGRKHGYGGPYDITDISFSAKAYAKDGKATCRCNWNEYRMVDANKIITQSTEVFVETNEVVLLNSFKEFIKVEFKFFDGSVHEEASNSVTKNNIEFKLKNIGTPLYEVRFKKSN